MICIKCKNEVPYRRRDLICDGCRGNKKEWISTTGERYWLTEEEINFLNENIKINNAVPIPRTGITLDGQDLYDIFHSPYVRKD